MYEKIIITEDTKSGKEFLEKLNRGLFGSRIFISSTALSSGDSGGNTKFSEKVNELIESGDIGQGSLVFLAFDNISVEKGSVLPRRQNRNTQSMLIQKRRNLLRDIETCKINIAAVGAETRRSTYLCIEESLAMTPGLWDITEPYKGSETPQNTRKVKYAEYETDLLRVYKIMLRDESLFTEKPPRNSQYLAYLHPLMIKHQKTEEQLFSDILYVITHRNIYADFGVSKSRIGLCLYVDCSALENTGRVHCESCSLENKPDYKYLKSGHRKMIFWKQKSRIGSVFKALMR